jgi:hypothetical protein
LWVVFPGGDRKLSVEIFHFMTIRPTQEVDPSVSSSNIVDLNGVATDFLQGGRTSDSEISNLHYSANTNLEHISDWLSKGLVAVALINLKDLPSLLKSLAIFIGGNPNDPTASVFLINFSAVGCIGGYLLRHYHGLCPWTLQL